MNGLNFTSKSVRILMGISVLVAAILCVFGLLHLNFRRPPFQPIARDPLSAILCLACGLGLASWALWRQGEARRIATELCERRQRKDQLQKLSRAVEQSPISIVMTDRSGNIEYVNPKFCETTGYTFEEVRGRNPRVLKSGDMPPETYRRLWETILAGHEWRGELRNKKKGGQLYWEFASISPIVDEAGRITSFVAVKEDITERKRAEQALLESEARFRAIGESAQDAIIMIDHEGCISFWNQAAERIFGYTYPEVKGRDLHSLLTPERYREMFRQAFPAFGATGAGAAVGKTLELTALRRDGTEFPADLSLAAVKLNSQWHAVGILRDITHKKEADARLEAAQHQLLEISRLAGMAEVATNILHNLGNVLNSVNVASACAADLLRNSGVATLSKVAKLLRQHETDWSAFATTDPRGKQLPKCLDKLAECLLAEKASLLQQLNDVQKGIDHIKDIVTTQQAYSTVSGIAETIQPSELVRDALRLNASSLARRDIQVTEELAPAPPVTVDKHKALSILVNLIQNAKHACDESARPDKRLTVRVANGEGRVKISVLDNGTGIPPENFARIFNHGFTTRKNGHGFGLHSGALAARELGGSLTAQSDGPGKGAVFTLELPAAPQVTGCRAANGPQSMPGLGGI